LIQNLLKNDPDFHQDDDEKGILDPVPFDTGLEQARMTDRNKPDFYNA